MAAAKPYEDIRVGDALAAWKKPPITRSTLALFAGASHDHNPIHIDSDYANAAGLPDVFAHGMLSMAYLGQALVNWIPSGVLRSFEVRFVAITHVGDEIECSGSVLEKLELDGKRCVRLAIQTANQAGEVKLHGEALLII